MLVLYDRLTIICIFVIEIFLHLAVMKAAGIYVSKKNNVRKEI